ncbi:O-methyltransferase, partial [Microcystis viridis]|uniref:O-methyltransferase n=1 Tax=Microcystis viridis TaxID=44822 RepID=UPI003BB66DC2
CNGRLFVFLDKNNYFFKKTLFYFFVGYFILWKSLILEIETDIDLVLLDHWKELYVRDFEVCWPKLKTGGCIVADNILRPQKNAAVISAYLDRVRACTDARSTLLPIGDGIEMTVKI